MWKFDLNKVIRKMESVDALMRQNPTKAFKVEHDEQKRWYYFHLGDTITEFVSTRIIEEKAIYLNNYHHRTKGWGAVSYQLEGFIRGIIEDMILDQNTRTELQLSRSPGTRDIVMDLQCGSRKLLESPTSKCDRVIDVAGRRTSGEHGTDADE